MLELSSMGAKVLHNRCVEIGKKYNVPINVKSSFVKESKGTSLKDVNDIETCVISSITCQDKITKLEIILNNKSGVIDSTYKILEKINKNNIKYDMLTLQILKNNKDVLSFCINNNDIIKLTEILKINSKIYRIKKVITKSNLSKISIIGIGIFSNQEIMNRILKVFQKNNINIYLITTSEIKISILVEDANIDFTLRCLHRELF